MNLNHNDRITRLNVSYTTFDSNDNENLEIDINIPNQSKDSNHLFKRVVIFLSLIVCGIILFSLTGHYNSLVMSLAGTSSVSSSVVSYNITINVTSPTYGENPSSIDSLPWDAVAEPFRDQVISLSSLIINGTAVDVSDDDYSIIWSINNHRYIGQEVSFKIEGTGIYSSSVTITPLSTSPYYRLKSVKDVNSRTTAKHRQYRSHLNEFKYKHSENEITSSYELYFTLASKYIRREIRSLTDDDRNIVFDTMRMLYDIDTATGQALYGDKYYSAEYFSYVHLTGAGTNDCDHWHDGAGIAVKHVGVTLQYEQALQSIDPSIALPYWDYGMDKYLYNEDSISNFPIFASDWFGELKSSTNDYSISDGSRWDGIVVPNGTAYLDWNISATGSFNPYVNGYGQLRSPWNNNPNPLIARDPFLYNTTAFTYFPSCDALYDCYLSSSLADVSIDFPLTVNHKLEYM